MRKPIKIQIAILLLIFLILIIPFIQVTFNIIKLTDLKGAISKPEKVNISVRDWFSGDYQKKEEKYLNESFGFRSLFIRINNQLAFSLFHKAIANGVIIGKKNYLFEENYIKAYYGTDFIGVDSITHRMSRLKFIQDTLSRLNKNLILVFAAGKGSFYPEYFPEQYKTTKGVTNYETHVGLAKKMGLNYIDFNEYFLENKEKSKNPLYPQYGIHWSNYGMCFVADSMIRYIEKLRGIDMPNLYWDEIKFSNRPKEDDYDIANGMNLMFKLRSFKMAYPVIHFQSDSGKTRPSVLVISDSFYWGMFNFGISNVFSNSHFWFYNKQIYPDSFNSPLETSQVNLKEEIARYDVIIILGTEATLPGFGWGFIENTYNFFKGLKTYSGQCEQRNPEYVINDETTIEVKIHRKVIELRNCLKTDKKWMEQIEKKAVLNKISVDSMIVLDAIWLIQNENKN
jgi:hypothetical protein